MQFVMWPRAITTSPRFQGLSSDARHALRVIKCDLLPLHGYCVVRGFLEHVAALMGSTLDVTGAAVGELERAGWLEHDAPTNSVWLINALKYHSARESGTSQAAAARDFNALPDTRLRERIGAYYSAYLVDADLSFTPHDRSAIGGPQKPRRVVAKVLVPAAERKRKRVQGAVASAPGLHVVRGGVSPEVMDAIAFARESGS